MSLNGWIKLWRLFEKWEWYTDSITKSVFIHLLIKANHKETKYRGHIIPRGSLVYGRKTYSKELNISEQNIRTAISHLKSTSEITTKSTNKFTIITLCNYDVYQSNEDANQPANQPASQPTTNQQLTTSKEYKNKRIKEYNIACAQILDYFNLVCHKNLSLSPQRERVVSDCLKAGRTVEQIKLAIDNFSQDTWIDRPKYTDIQYAIGIVRGIDNFDKWFSYKPKPEENLDQHIKTLLGG